jgi:hypothetical protein
MAHLRLVAVDQVGRVADNGVARAEDVGDHEAVDFLRRVGHRHIEHADAVAGVGQPPPERGLTDARRVDEGEVLAVGLDEVEDAVLAGVVPVMNVGQAGLVTGGRVEARSAVTPSRIRPARLGRKPSAAQGLIRSKVAPSKPIISKVIAKEYTARSGRRPKCHWHL